MVQEEEIFFSKFWKQKNSEVFLITISPITFDVLVSSSGDETKEKLESSLRAQRALQQQQQLQIKPKPVNSNGKTLVPVTNLIQRHNSLPLNNKTNVAAAAGAVHKVNAVNQQPAVIKIVQKTIRKFPLISEFWQIIIRSK